jgi:uncharacterized protein YxeA
MKELIKIILILIIVLVGLGRYFHDSVDAKLTKQAMAEIKERDALHGDERDQFDREQEAEQEEIESYRNSNEDYR